MKEDPLQRHHGNEHPYEDDINEVAPTLDDSWHPP